MELNRDKVRKAVAEYVYFLLDNEPKGEADAAAYDSRRRKLHNAIAEIMGVKPEDCVLYDDSIAACRSAKKAGLKTVGVFDEHCSENKAELRMICDEFIMSFEDLLKS